MIRHHEQRHAEGLAEERRSGLLLLVLALEGDGQQGIEVLLGKPAADLLHLVVGQQTLRPRRP